jgi:hypothetical protein
VRDTLNDEHFRLREGAFAMFDALGMRGVWRRKDAEQVVRKFKALRARFKAQLERELGGPTYKHIRDKGNVIEDVIVGFLSDTVVIAVVPKEQYLRENRRALETFSLILAARFAGVAMSMAADNEPRWAYRGSISFGSLVAEHDGTFFIGEAVDDAAELFAQPDGAFICLTPSAVERFHVSASQPVGLTPLWRHRVPLKDGRALDTFVVSPFDNAPRERAREITTAILSTFTNRPLDVALKAQNTRAFLIHHLEEYCRAVDAQQEEVARLLRSSDPG